MGIIGLAGGLAVDRGWGTRPSRSVAIGIVTAAVVWTVIGWRFFGGELKQSLSNVFLTGGRGLGLMLHPASDAQLTISQAQEPDAETA
jgi:hypothetical protein